jgi:hypothetical protein
VALPCLFYPSADASAQTVVLADTLRDILDGIRFSGQLLRVTWVAKDDRSVERYGRITEVSFPTTRADDIKWKATFEWKGALQAAVSVSSTNQSIATARAAALAASDAASRIESANIIQSNPRIQDSADTFTLGQLESLLEAPRDLVASFARFGTAVAGEFRSIADLVNKVRGEPDEILDQLVNLARSVVGVCNQVSDELARETPERLTARIDLQQLLVTLSYYGGAQTQAELLARQSTAALLAARRQRSAASPNGADPQSLLGAGGMLAVIVPKDGETLLSISRRYYSGVDYSFELARANGLSGQTIVPPRGPLVVPTLDVIRRLRARV